MRLAHPHPRPRHLEQPRLAHVESYNLGAASTTCPQVWGKISVVAVPLDYPAGASVVSTPDVSPAIGCHDIPVLLEKKLAGAACISETQQGSFSIPQGETATVCTAHNFNTLPLTNGRDVLTTAWYTGGTTVLDFTDTLNPVQLGFYIPKTPVAGNSWSSYWYRDRIYANNLGSRGFDSLELADAALKANAIDLSRLNPTTMEPLTPTAVAVRSLRSVATARSVVVRWRTDSETQLAGFNLYRSRGSGKLTRLNRVLIRARFAGTPGGQAYTYTDRGARGGATYHLELVGLDGRKTWVGTTTARAA